jgi:hypothetical protein
MQSLFQSEIADDDQIVKNAYERLEDDVNFSTDLNLQAKLKFQLAILTVKGRGCQKNILSALKLFDSLMGNSQVSQEAKEASVQCCVELLSSNYGTLDYSNQNFPWYILRHMEYIKEGILENFSNEMKLFLVKKFNDGFIGLSTKFIRDNCSKIIRDEMHFALDYRLEVVLELTIFEQHIISKQQAENRNLYGLNEPIILEHYIPSEQQTTEDMPQSTVNIILESLATVLADTNLSNETRHRAEICKANTLFWNFTDNYSEVQKTAFMDSWTYLKQRSDLTAEEEILKSAITYVLEEEPQVKREALIKLFNYARVQNNQTRQYAIRALVNISLKSSNFLTDIEKFEIYELAINNNVEKKFCVRKFIEPLKRILRENLSSPEEFNYRKRINELQINPDTPKEFGELSHIQWLFCEKSFLTESIKHLEKNKILFNRIFFILLATSAVGLVPLILLVNKDILIANANPYFILAVVAESLFFIAALCFKYKVHTQNQEIKNKNSRLEQIASTELI